MLSDKQSTPNRRKQDPREFSDDGSEDSGFEESVSPTDHTKERRLKNDKYDMALEVSRVTSNADRGLLHCCILQGGPDRNS